MKRFIAVTTEDRAFLIKTFKVDVRTVRSALSYAYDSPTCKRIRKLALQRGGVPMVSDCIEYETIHDANGIMTQLMENGAVIRVSKHTGHLTVEYKGEIRIESDITRIDELAAIQEAARALK